MVILEKTPFGEDSLTEIFKGAKTNLEVKNDIYSTYVFQLPAHLNGTLTYTAVNFLRVFCFVS